MSTPSESSEAFQARQEKMSQAMGRMFLADRVAKMEAAASTADTRDGPRRGGFDRGGFRRGGWPGRGRGQLPAPAVFGGGPGGRGRGDFFRALHGGRGRGAAGRGWWDQAHAARGDTWAGWDSHPWLSDTFPASPHFAQPGQPDASAAMRSARASRAPTRSLRPPSPGGKHDSQLSPARMGMTPSHPVLGSRALSYSPVLSEDSTAPEPFYSTPTPVAKPITDRTVLHDEPEASPSCPISKALQGSEVDQSGPLNSVTRQSGLSPLRPTPENLPTPVQLSTSPSPARRSKADAQGVRIVDASVLVYSLRSVHELVKQKRWRVIIPLDALHTMDRLKSARDPLVSHAVRRAMRFIDTHLVSFSTLGGSKAGLVAQRPTESTDWEEVLHVWQQRLSLLTAATPGSAGASSNASPSPQPLSHSVSRSDSSSDSQSESNSGSSSSSSGSSPRSVRDARRHAHSPDGERSPSTSSFSSWGGSSVSAIEAPPVHLPPWIKAALQCTLHFAQTFPGGDVKLFVAYPPPPSASTPAPVDAMDLEPIDGHALEWAARQVWREGVEVTPTSRTWLDLTGVEPSGAPPFKATSPAVALSDPKARAGGSVPLHRRWHRAADERSHHEHRSKHSPDHHRHHHHHTSRRHHHDQHHHKHHQGHDDWDHHHHDHHHHGLRSARHGPHPSAHLYTMHQGFRPEGHLHPWPGDPVHDVQPVLGSSSLHIEDANMRGKGRHRKHSSEGGKSENESDVPAPPSSSAHGPMRLVPRAASSFDPASWRPGPASYAGLPLSHGWSGAPLAPPWSGEMSRLWSGPQGLDPFPTPGEARHRAQKHQELGKSKGKAKDMALDSSLDSALDPGRKEENDILGMKEKTRNGDKGKGRSKRMGREALEPRMHGEDAHEPHSSPLRHLSISPAPGMDGEPGSEEEFPSLPSAPRPMAQLTSGTLRPAMPPRARR